MSVGRDGQNRPVRPIDVYQRENHGDIMGVTMEITVPADAFTFATVHRDFPEAVIELERIVPLRSEDDRRSLLVWISNGDPDAVETSLLETSGIESVERVTNSGDRTLFEVTWNEDIDGIIQPLFRTGGRILSAVGTAGEWELHLLFDSHESLSAFNMAVTNVDIPITLRKLHNPTFRGGDPSSPLGEISLSTKHRETLLLAYRNGYYDVPRRSQLDALAAKESVSDSALSKRLRRATASLIEQTLLAEESDPAFD